MPDDGLIREIEQFLHHEARLLDTGRFHEWLQLFTSDVHYWMTGRRDRYPQSSKAITMLDPLRYADEGENGPDDRGLFDEDITTLTARVARLDTGMAWAEDPPSRTRHLITNIEVVPTASESELTVHCNFLVYRSRGETEQDFYVGAREDLLRRVDGGWKIASRGLTLDQNVLTAKNLSIFF
jgi:3-phenylpropionate/cinnamic acid dioxygenase small subunit